MDLSRQMNWASLEVRFIWQVLPKVFLPLKIKRHIQECFIGQTSESLDEKIKFMSMFNDIEWTKEGDTETGLHNAKEVAAIATQFMPGPCCFLALASESTWWNGNSNEPQRKWDTVAVQIVDLFKCHTSHWDISSDRAIIAWTVGEKRKQLPFPRYIRKQEDSHRDHAVKQFTMYLPSNFAIGIN